MENRLQCQYNKKKGREGVYGEEKRKRILHDLRYGKHRLNYSNLTQFDFG